MLWAGFFTKSLFCYSVSHLMSSLVPSIRSNQLLLQVLGARCLVWSQHLGLQTSRLFLCSRVFSVLPLLLAPSLSCLVALAPGSTLVWLAALWCVCVCLGRRVGREKYRHWQDAIVHGSLLLGTCSRLNPARRPFS